MNEFELISHFFSNQIKQHRADVALGIGDDCAILNLPPEHQLLVSIDTLVNDVHFPSSSSAFDIGYKALAVNLSDLAAMGATPAWITLALTLPKANETWLHDFSKGLFTLAKEYQVELIGGDTTRGPLTISIQAHGFVPRGKAITRSGAKPGDLIYVTQQLGDAGLALKHIQQKLVLSDDILKPVLTRLNRPHPRIKEGIALRGIATAMIDISDGLISDLKHILKRSQVGAVIDAHHIPISSALRQSLPEEEALKMALSAGDDYELCFCINKTHKNKLEQIRQEHNFIFHCIGEITSEPALVINNKQQKIDLSDYQGFLHF